MAIINSITVGKGRKSLGNVTLQHYYGKTVAKQKILANKNYVPTAAQLSQRDYFKPAAMIAGAYNPLIKKTFTRTKSGSSFNNFIKLNYPSIKTAIFDNTSNNAWNSSVLKSSNLPDSGQVGGAFIWLDSIYRGLTTDAAETPTNLPYITYGTSAAYAVNNGKIVFQYYSSDNRFQVFFQTFPISVYDNSYKKVTAQLIYVVLKEGETIEGWNPSGDMPVSIGEETELILNDGVWTLPLDTDGAGQHPLMGGYTASAFTQLTLYGLVLVKIDGTPLTLPANFVSFNTTYTTASTARQENINSLAFKINFAEAVSN